MTLLLVVTTLLAVAALAVQTWHRRPLSPAPRLTGKTVEIEREGYNVRGVVVAQHSDRFTLSDALGRNREGELVPLEHQVVHILPDHIRSISEID